MEHVVVGEERVCVMGLWHVCVLRVWTLLVADKAIDIAGRWGRDSVCVTCVCYVCDLLNISGQLTPLF